MRELGRVWVALTALGAGLVHLGVAARTPPALLVPLALLGAVEVAWGVVALVRRGAPRPTVALVVALAAPAAWGVLAVVGVVLPGIALPAGPMAGATALDLAAAMMLAGRRLVRPGSTPPPWRFLGGLAVGGIVVAGVVTVSLGAGTPAGMPGMGM